MNNFYWYKIFTKFCVIAHKLVHFEFILRRHIRIFHSGVFHKVHKFQPSTIASREFFCTHIFYCTQAAIREIFLQCFCLFSSRIFPIFFLWIFIRIFVSDYFCGFFFGYPSFFFWYHILLSWIFRGTFWSCSWTLTWRIWNIIFRYHCHYNSNRENFNN